MTLYSNSKEYFMLWIGRLRCVIDFGAPGQEARFSFSPTEFPRQRHGNGVLIQKHFRKKGRWHLTKRISRKEEIALATIVNQAHSFIHKLVLAKGTPKNLPVNANYESGTAWDVR
ncbi:MAG: hypothetical protein OXB98_17335 [Bryobacterales bacterium]|nr:hypothetical protein [Bryobacterales bacterium]